MTAKPTYDELQKKVEHFERMAKDAKDADEEKDKEKDAKDADEEKDKDTTDAEEYTDKDAKDSDEEEKDAEDGDDDDKKDAKDSDKEKAMDARFKKISAELAQLKRTSMDTKSLLAEISKRDALANELSHHIGVFDHAEKTLDEVATYGVKKLGLTCPKGGEHLLLTGFLAGRKQTAVHVSSGADSRIPANSALDAYINGE